MNNQSDAHSVGAGVIGKLAMADQWKYDKRAALALADQLGVVVEVGHGGWKYIGKHAIQGWSAVLRYLQRRSERQKT